MKKSHDEAVREAMHRLEIHRDFLMYRGRGGYGGSVARDLQRLLDELEYYRLTVGPRRDAEATK